ncbi:Syntaxin-23 [Platanthera zijinensis]|uniref:Syntaxin-23 n=1 Tax=Platanthera zijinensis TaxID=2320716 RepID=A0AAP0C1V9_9ASPA
MQLAARKEEEATNKSLAKEKSLAFRAESTRKGKERIPSPPRRSAESDNSDSEASDSSMSDEDFAAFFRQFQRLMKKKHWNKRPFNSTHHRKNQSKTDRAEIESQIIKRNLPMLREVSKEEAQNRILAINEPYKLEILESIKDDSITIYHIVGYLYGPHVDSTGFINTKAVELESVAGAYWRGDEKKKMLQRIYGTAWETEEQLKAYFKFKEEAEKRDHRRLGQDLDLFSIQLAKDFQAVLKEFQKAQRLAAERETAYAPFVPQAVLPSRSILY